MTTHAEHPAQVPARPDNLGQFVRRNALQLGIVGVFFLLWIVLVIFAPLTFGSREIYGALMSTIPFFGMVALPLTLVVIAREIDVSFGSIMAIGMTTFSLVLSWTGSSFLALVACLTVGFLVGLLNGIIIVRVGIPSLIATIGAMFFWRGAVIVISNGQGVSLVNLKGTVLRELLVGRIAGFIPAQMVWMLLMAGVVWILLNRHRFGAHIYLIGDNENSARLMGVNVNRTRTLIFAIVGLAAAFAGLMTSLELSYFWPSTLGEGYLMTTLAAVFLGGTSVFGGTGTVMGTFLGRFIIAAIQPGTVAIGLTGYWTQLIYGFIIVVSVAMHTVLRKRIG